MFASAPAFLPGSGLFSARHGAFSACAPLHRFIPVRPSLESPQSPLRRRPGSLFSAPPSSASPHPPEPAMPAPVNKETDAQAHIDIHDDRVAPREDTPAASPGMRNSKGWDGKLRVPKSALVANPEALSDSEYSDEDNVLPGEEISADEGGRLLACSPCWNRWLTSRRPRPAR